MLPVRREAAGAETWLKYASTQLGNIMLTNRHRRPNNWRVCNLWSRGRKLACLALSTWANSVVVAFWFFFAVKQKCIRGRDTNGWLVVCEFVKATGSAEEWGNCSRCGRFHLIRRISRFPFEGSRFGCGPLVRACLRNWCTCVLDTRSSKRFCESCCRIRCIRFEYIRMLSVLMLRTCCTRGICILLVSVYCPGSLHSVQ
jgi:hypothetical protein